MKRNKIFSSFLASALLILCVPCLGGSTQPNQGFRLSQVQPGSVYQGLGLRDGDLLLSYNGHPISEEKGIQVLLDRVFKTPGKLKLTIKRNEKLEDFNYDIK